MSSGRFQKKATDRSVISCGGNVFEPGATAQASRLPAAVYRATRLYVREHDHVCGRTVSGIRVNTFQLPCGNAGGLAAHSVVAVCAVGRRICGCDGPPEAINCFGDRHDRRVTGAGYQWNVGSFERCVDLCRQCDYVCLQWVSSTCAGCHDTPPGRPRGPYCCLSPELLSL